MPAAPRHSNAVDDSSRRGSLPDWHGGPALQPNGGAPVQQFHDGSGYVNNWVGQSFPPYQQAAMHAQFVPEEDVGGSFDDLQYTQDEFDMQLSNFARENGWGNSYESHPYAAHNVTSLHMHQAQTQPVMQQYDQNHNSQQYQSQQHQAQKHDARQRQIEHHQNQRYEITPPRAPGGSKRKPDPISTNDVSRAKRRVMESSDSSDSDDDSDDDKPLMLRLSQSPRKPTLSQTPNSVPNLPTSPNVASDKEIDTGKPNKSQAPADRTVAHSPDSVSVVSEPVNIKEEDEDIEMSDKSKDQGHPTMSQPSGSTPHLGTSATVNNSAPTDTDAETSTISWKLPEYEARAEEDPQGFPLAKVSLPGIIRHVIQLSVDHSDLELLLIQKVFIPSHQNTYGSGRTPDPDPKLSLLNFHTIAILVIEAYHTFKEDNVSNPDTDEVFFTVIDRWRIGRESKRGAYNAVRGIQEFCDVALEVLFWIKEHGLGETETAKGRKKRKDKGVKRGPYGKGKAAASAGRGKAASGTKKVNQLVARPKKKGTATKVKSGGTKKA